MKNALLGLSLLIYPFVIYFALPYVEPSILAVFFGLIFVLRHFGQISGSTKQPAKFPHFNILLISVLSLLAYTGLANSAMALKFYPVVVNLSFLIIFSYSLYKPPSIVETIARLHEKLDDEGIAYTRKVTQIWCIFFVFNAAIATWSAFHSDPKVWLLYNGLISYILVGALVGGELFYRKVIKTRLLHKFNNKQK